MFIYSCTFELIFKSNSNKFLGPDCAYENSIEGQMYHCSTSYMHLTYCSKHALCQMNRKHQLWHWAWINMKAALWNYISVKLTFLSMQFVPITINNEICRHLVWYIGGISIVFSRQGVLMNVWILLKATICFWGSCSFFIWIYLDL